MRLDAVKNIKVPDFDVVEERPYDSEVGSGYFGRAVARRRDWQPFQTDGEGAEHDIVVHIQIVVALFIDVDFQMAVLIFLTINYCETLVIGIEAFAAF